jgi:hypothetical protein
MKFKELSKKIRNIVESGGGEHTEGGSLQAGDPRSTSVSALSDFGTFRLDNDAMLDRLNAFLHAYSGKEFLDVDGAMSVLKNKLNIVGLDFKPTKIMQGQNLIKLYQYGSTALGVFGVAKDLKTNLAKEPFSSTAGLDDQFDYSLMINAMKTPSHLTKLDIQIVRNGETIESDCGCQH